MTVQSAPATQDELLSEWHKKAASGPVSKAHQRLTLKL